MLTFIGYKDPINSVIKFLAEVKFKYGLKPYYIKHYLKLILKQFVLHTCFYHNSPIRILHKNKVKIK